MFLVCGLAVALAIIFYVDWFYAPGALRDRAVAATIARGLVDGAHVEVDSDFEDRFVQKAFIEMRARRPDVIVLGSSRSLQIRAALFPNETFFNHASWGSIIIDYMGLLGLYDSKNQLPPKVIIGVDPWVFNRLNDQRRWWPLFGSFRRMAAKLQIFDSALPTTRYVIRSLKDLFDIHLARLVSIDQLRHTLGEIARCQCLEARPRTGIRLLDDERSQLMVKRPDGSLRYIHAERTKSPALLARESTAFGTANPIYGFREFTGLDKLAVAHFLGLLQYLKGRGVEVILFLSPYHPTAYNLIRRKRTDRMVVEVENFLRETAAGLGPAQPSPYPSDASRAPPCGCRPRPATAPPAQACQGPDRPARHHEAPG